MKKVYNLMAMAVVMLAASCGTSYSDSPYYSGDGQGGSMARFCIVGDNLFTVDHNSLNLFDISEPEEPRFMRGRTQNLDFGIETIFPMDSLLFIGSWTGMHIFHVSERGLPQHLSTTYHFLSCDPVVVQDNYAYVTLNSSSMWCGQRSNLLQIYDITELTDPKLVREVAGFHSPAGLGIAGDKLFVCDQGLKVFDISDRTSPKWVSDLYDVEGLKDDVIGAYDVIVLKDFLILVSSEGIYQLDYSGDTLKLLSKIDIKK